MLSITMTLCIIVVCSVFLLEMPYASGAKILEPEIKIQHYLDEMSILLPRGELAADIGPKVVCHPVHPQKQSKPRSIRKSR